MVILIGQTRRKSAEAPSIRSGIIFKNLLIGDRKILFRVYIKI